MRVYVHVETIMSLKHVFLQEVRDKYGAVVKMIDSGDKLKLDQNHVETVIPAPGKAPKLFHPYNPQKKLYTLLNIVVVKLMYLRCYFSILLSILLSNFLQVNVF